jgi:hypothetical protein
VGAEGGVVHEDLVVLLLDEFLEPLLLRLDFVLEGLEHGHEVLVGFYERLVAHEDIVDVGY